MVANEASSEQDILILSWTARLLGTGECWTTISKSARTVILSLHDNKSLSSARSFGDWKMLNLRSGRERIDYSQVANLGA